MLSDIFLMHPVQQWNVLIHCKRNKEVFLLQNKDASACLGEQKLFQTFAAELQADLRALSEVLLVIL